VLSVGKSSNQDGKIDGKFLNDFPLLAYVLPLLGRFTGSVALIGLAAHLVSIIFLLPWAGYTLSPTNLAIVAPINVQMRPSTLAFAVDICERMPRKIEIVFGSHGIGKTTAFMLAADELSKLRPVRYFSSLDEIDSTSPYRHFYHMPPLSRWTGSSKELEWLRPANDFDRYKANVNGSSPPLLIADNIETDSIDRLVKVVRALKVFTDQGLLKVVIIASNSLIIPQLRLISAFNSRCQVRL
jgi:hypothetical protein